MKRLYIAPTFKIRKMELDEEMLAASTTIDGSEPGPSDTGETGNEEDQNAKYNTYNVWDEEE